MEDEQEMEMEMEEMNLSLFSRSELWGRLKKRFRHRPELKKKYNIKFESKEKMIENLEKYRSLPFISSTAEYWRKLQVYEQLTGGKKNLKRKRNDVIERRVRPKMGELNRVSVLKNLERVAVITDTMKRNAIKTNILRKYLGPKVMKMRESLSVESNSSMKDTSMYYRIYPNTYNRMKVEVFLDTAKSYMTDAISAHMVKRKHGLRVTPSLNITFTDKNSGKEDVPHFFGCKTPGIVTHPEDINEVVDNNITSLKTQIQEFDGKGYSMDIRVVKLNMTMNDYMPISASSYIKLPEHLENKQACVNIQNDDNKCFAYSIALHLLQLENNEENAQRLARGEKKKKIDNASRVTKKLKAKLNELNWEGINFPMKCCPKVIQKFTELNNISVTVFKYDSDDKKIHPYVRAPKICDIHVQLLHIENDVPEVFTAEELLVKHLEPLIKNFKAENPQCSCNDVFVEQERLTALLSEEDIQSFYMQSAEQTKVFDEFVPNSHYVYVKNMSALLNDTHAGQHKKFFCENCLYSSEHEHVINKHIEESGCYNNEPGYETFPKKEDAQVKFNNHKHKLPVPYVIYCDTECICKAKNCPHLFPDTPEDETKKTKKPFSRKKPTSTKVYQEHVCCSAGYYIVTPYERTRYKFFRGEDAMTKFLDAIWNEKNRILWKCKTENAKPMIITPEEQRLFEKSKCCHLCEKAYTVDEMQSKEGSDYRVRDHDHLNGKYRGSAHNSCNMKHNYCGADVPVVFHNLKGYDGHLVITELNTAKYNNIEVIAQNPEKYISIKIGKLKFIDSFAFLASKMETLVKNLRYGATPEEINERFKHTRKHFPELDNKTFKLLIRKGIYPYDYMDSFERFEETELPPKSAFYSKLSGEHVSDLNYNHALTIWKIFKMKNLGDYHDLYLKLDVLLLADVMENFRKIELTTYKAKLDPMYYLSLPHYSWDCMLKITGKTISLFNDEQRDMYYFCEEMKRGGVSMISLRHAVANNKHMNEKFKKDTISSYIHYIDANNLYGLAMCELLPIDSYKWSEKIHWTEDEILKLDPKGKFGYFFEVDLHYPKELHDLHNQLPCAPERTNVTDNMLSPYSRGLKKKLNENYKFDSKTQENYKLILSLSDKKKYKVHYRTLQLYIELGLKVTKVHRVLEFRQEDWLAEYINENTRLRANAKNEFEKDLYKLKNNAVFGKTMENVRNRIDFKLFTSEECRKKTKAISSYCYKDDFAFNDHLVGVLSAKKNIKLNKPLAVGCAVLDLSKRHMYNFHYNVMMKKYGHERCQLLMTDTDSLVYHIITKDLYKDMEEIKDEFLDTSNYPKDHPLYSEKNKKVVGMFKDENAKEKEYVRNRETGELEEFDEDDYDIVEEDKIKVRTVHITTEFIGLKPKMYSSIYYEDEDGIHKVKGVNKATSKLLKHQDFRDCYNNEEYKKDSMTSLRSYKHNIKAIQMTKISLSPYDDKSYYFDGGFALRYGHYKVVEHMKKN